MRTYWTIQSFEKWIEIEKEGHLTANPKFIWSEFIEAYHWLMKKMNEKIPNYQGQYPVWLWTNRPDLRKSGHLNPGEQGVLLKVEIEENRVLLSDFQAWHFVLNNWYFNLEEVEVNDSHVSQDAIEKSWEMIFYVDDLIEHPNWGKEICTLQGVTNHVNSSEITLVKKFTAR